MPYKKKFKSSNFEIFACWIYLYVFFFLTCRNIIIVPITQILMSFTEMCKQYSVNVSMAFRSG